MYISKYDNLIQHLINEHDLILLNSEIHSIDKCLDKDLTNIKLKNLKLISKDTPSELKNHLNKWSKAHTKKQNDSYAIGFRHCFHYMCDWIKQH